MSSPLIRRHRARSRSACVGLVAAGAVVAQLATMAPAVASTSASYSSTAGSSSQTLVTDTGTVGSSGSLVLGPDGTVKAVRCAYSVNETAGTSGSGSKNSAVHAAVDYQSTTLTDRVIDLDIADTDNNTGGAASFGGTGYIIQPGTTTSVCTNPLRKLTSTTPSYARQASAWVAGTAVSIATYGVIAVVGAYFSGGTVLGNPYFEAFAGCLAGVTGKLVTDKILTGNLDTWANYFAKCASSAVFTGGLAAFYKYLAANPNAIVNAIANASRYFYGDQATAAGVLGNPVRGMLTYVGQQG